MAANLDRRQALTAASAAAAAAVLGGTDTMAQNAQPSGKGAELIFRDGTILTMIDDRPQVGAVAVSGGKILAAGDEATIMAFKGARDGDHRPKGAT